MNAHESMPEWFSMAEADWAENPQAVNAKKLKTRRNSPIRLLAISTPLLVLGAGLLFAQTQQAPDAFAAAASTVIAAPITPATTTASTAIQSSVTSKGAPATNYQTPVVITPRVASTNTSNALSTLQSGLNLPAKGSAQLSDESGSDDVEGQDD